MKVIYDGEDTENFVLLNNSFDSFDGLSLHIRTLFFVDLF